MGALMKMQRGSLSLGGSTDVRNLLPNGDFEADVAGWTVNGATVAASSAEQAYTGSKSCKITVNDAVASFFPMFQNVTLPGSGTYRFRIALWLPTAYTGTLIRLTDNTQFSGATDTFPVGANMGLRDQWQLLTATCTPAADLSGLFGIQDTNASGDGTFFYVDTAEVRRIV